MRAVVVLVVAAGCRNALGIPGETSVETYEVRGEIRGLVGVSEPVQLVLDTYAVTPTEDGAFAFTGVANGTAGTITPSSGACVVFAGADVEIDSAGADGVKVRCDGLLALGGVTASAPLDVPFAPSDSATVLASSAIVQRTSLDYSFAYPMDGAPSATITFDDTAYTPGDARALTGTHRVLFTLVNEQAAGLPQPRTYDLAIQTDAAPAAFGYGKSSMTIEAGHLGAAVAADGDRAVVGMPGHAAIVFQRSGRVWVEEAVLVGDGDQFGASVAIAGTRVVVGAPGSATAPGGVAVFDLVGGAWQQTQTLHAPSPAADDRFGAAVAVTATHVIAGAPGPSCHAAGGGCVFEFQQPNDAVTALHPAAAGDRFGASLATSGGDLVVGAPGDDSSGPPGDTQYPDAGAAYVFALGSTAVAQYLKPDFAGAGDQFGTAVAIDGNFLVVGAPLEDSDGTSADNNAAIAAGAAYVFERSGPWTQRRYVKAPAVHVGDNFGRAVAIVSSTVGSTTTTVVAIGAPFDDADDTAPDAGAVYAYRFDRATAALGMPHAARQSNIGAGDAFGFAIALTPETLLVGAPFEDGAGTSWNAPANEAALDAGAIYSVR